MAQILREIEYRGQKGSVRIVPETAKRPNVVYLDHPQAKEILNELAEIHDPESKTSGVGGLFIPDRREIFSISERRELGDVSIQPPVRDLEDELGISDNSIVLPSLSPESRRAERLRHGSVLAHEFEHYKGGHEYLAYRRSAEYLRRNGMTPQHGEDVVEIVNTLKNSGIYPPEDVFAAGLEALFFASVPVSGSISRDRSFQSKSFWRSLGARISSSLKSAFPGIFRGQKEQQPPCLFSLDPEVVWYE
ncbi:MAG: hypothetical protein KDD64_03735 [Bdellovibrionales bacterium]|nr:hypothetical protein [Bdellovibrionales bacterium]